MTNALTEEPKTYTVLIVEDDPHTAELLAYNLSEAGFQVFSAEDGLSALHKLDIVTVDLIVCDVMMPEMDGFALRERINEDPVMREIPFIFKPIAWMLQKVSGDNDFLVPKISATWLNYQRDLRSDHMEVIGWNFTIPLPGTGRPFQHRQLYREIVEKMLAS